MPHFRVIMKLFSPYGEHYSVHHPLSYCYYVYIIERHHVVTRRELKTHLQINKNIMYDGIPGWHNVYPFGILFFVFGMNYDRL